MSKARAAPDTLSKRVIGADDSVPWQSAYNTPELLNWLDDQPGFIEVSRTTTLYRHESKHKPDFPTTIVGSKYGRTEVCTRERTALMHIDSRYEVSDRKSFSSQRDVMDAWEDFQFPAHNLTLGPLHDQRAAELYSLSSYTTGYEEPTITRWNRIGIGRGEDEIPAARFYCPDCGAKSSKWDPNHWQADTKRQDARDGIDKNCDCDGHYHVERGRRVTESEKNFTAYQRPDGSGYVMHYSRIAAIRTRNGLVLRNKQDFAKGRAHCTWPDDYAESPPLTGIRTYLSDEVETDETVLDIIGIEHGEVGKQTAYLSRDWYVLYFDSGAEMMVVYDETAQHYHQNWCGFYRAADEDSFDTDDMEAELRPDVATEYLDANDEAELVGSQEYSLRCRPGKCNGGFHDPERAGRDVIRQGEWFFVPAGETLADAVNEYVVDAETPHVSMDGDLPSVCTNCDATSFEVTQDDEVYCTECNALTVLDSNVSRPMGSHWADKEVRIGDTLFVRGMVHHDTYDHNAIHLPDWHVAVDNGYDGVVFDTSTPDRVSGRAGASAGMRVE